MEFSARSTETHRWHRNWDEIYQDFDKASIRLICCSAVRRVTVTCEPQACVIG